MVLPLSAKASAALSRRCLQTMLRDKFQKGKSLKEEIDCALPKLSPRVSHLVDAIRQIGNIAAHPFEKPSGGIVEVTPAEAELLIEVNWALIEDLYVTPHQSKKMAEQISRKYDESKKN